MLITFNKQNFEIMECLVVALFIYMVYTVFIRSRIEAHNCTGHSEPFRNMEGLGHASVEGMGHRNMEGLGHASVEGMGHANVEGYGYRNSRR